MDITQIPDATWCRANIPYTVSPTTNRDDADWIRMNNSIVWFPAKGPTNGTAYYATYSYRDADIANISVSCDYRQSIPGRQIWTAQGVMKNFYDGIIHNDPVSCSPGEPFMVAAPDIAATWEIPAEVTDLSLKIYDDNPLVQVYVNNGTIVGTLNENIPSRNWHPLIHNGFYYLGKEEYYIFNEITTYELTAESIDPATKKVVLPFTPAELAPIIIEVPGKTLRRVGFSLDNGQYTTSVTEDFVLTGKKDIRLSYNDIDPGYTIIAVTEDGIGFDVIDTDPTDNVVTLGINDEGSVREITDDEAKEYAGKVLFVTYQPKDCFAVEYQHNEITIFFSQYYDEGTIYYENMASLNNQIENIDMNPIVGLRDKGFLYVTPVTVDTRRYIYVDIHPMRIQAGQTSTITVTTYDSKMNPASTALTVTASDGTALTLAPNMPEGTYIYEYKSVSTQTGPVKISATNGTVMAEGTITVY